MSLINKALVAISTFNSPVFLDHFLETFKKIDPGYECDLLIIDNSSTHPAQLRILEKASKINNCIIKTKPNYGRAQAGYQFAWDNYKNYKYYFFLHDDSSFIRDGWLKIAIDRLHDKSLENVLNEDIKTSIYLCGVAPKPFQLKVGKVGFQAYKWGNKYHYFEENFNKRKQIFHYMDEVNEMLQINAPYYYQHINDDKILYSHECLSAIKRISNIEDWKQLEKTEVWNNILNFFKKNNLYNNTPFAPIERYGANYNVFQALSEYINDITPMMNGFRTHCVLGDGYCQEDLGWSNFRGNEYIVHYGDHVVFKRLSLLTNIEEDEIRKRFSNKTFLTFCDKIIKDDSKGEFNEK